MKLISRLLGSAIFVCAAVSASANVAPSPFSSLVVFGDSLSDSGNNTLHPLIGTNPGQVISGNAYIPSLTYGPVGTYSNGPVWATQFAGLLGLALTPSLAGGTNYAFGGALSGADQILHPSFPQFPLPGLKTQANSYLATHPGSLPADALYVVAGGGNDARATFSALATQTDFGVIGSVAGAAAAQYANNIGSIVDQLQAAGAQHIIVWDTPNIGLAPAIKAEVPFTAAGLTGPQLGSLVSGTLNGALTTRLAGEAGVQIFDIYGLVSLAGANGFTNTTDACGAPTNSGVCPADIAHALFWDGIHPTTAAHGFIAQQMFALAVAVPEPSEVAMLLIGFLFVVRVARRKVA